MKSQIMPTLFVRLRSHWARRRSLIFGSGLLVLAALLLLQLSGRFGAGARAAFVTVTVNTVADTVADDGVCSLREAIIAANTNTASGAMLGECAAGAVGADTIAFSIGTGTPTINVSGSPLPTITETVTIDGNTGGATRVELNGAGAGASANGLFINNTDNCAIKSLVINRFNGTPGVVPASGNGIRIVDSDNTLVENCYIGTDSTGNSALANGSNGIFGFSTNDSDIKNNLLSGNGQTGVYFHQEGAGCQRNNIRGNKIGTNLAGTAAIPNAENGVQQQSCTHSTIGGTTTADRNLVSGNIGNGMAISSFHQVLGNYVGVDVTGTAALGNGNGIGAGHNNIIGGTTPEARNIISANVSDGISFLSQGNGANSQVIGNYIGTDVTGTVDLGNNRYGVYIRESGDIVVGGTTPAERNIISGNTTVGVFLHAANDCQVLGNYIGPNVNGTAAFSSTYGVQVDSGAGNHLISGNVISGHSDYGVSLAHQSNNWLFGNIIGASPTLTAMPNGIGVTTGGATGQINQIGGTGTGEGNIIAFNNEDGVQVSFGTNHKISGNSIYSNGDLGIDLNRDGVTANDAGDGDSGTNNLQNFPVITQVTTNGIVGTLNSEANKMYTIQFFHNPACDTPGNGEGKTYIDQITVTTGPDGNTPINYLGAVPSGGVVTATATENSSGNTSEFSSCQTVVDCPPTITVSPATLPNGFTSTAYNQTITASPAGNYNYTLTGGNLPDGLQLVQVNASTGAVTGTPTVPGMYTFTITATTNGVCTGSQTYTIYINCPGATITVTTTLDNVTPDDKCSLREAIMAANGVTTANGCASGVSGLDTIYFYIGTGTPTINILGSQLPAITEPVVIDGSQCQSTRVELNGVGAGSNARGFSITAGNSTIRSMVINRFTESGISIATGGGNVVENCYLGTNSTGTAPLGNGRDGVRIASSPNNRIGSLNSSLGNLISGNSEYGVLISFAGATGNQVVGNYVGLHVNGTQAIGNGLGGVRINDAQNNLIGGTASGSRNYISGNVLDGVFLLGTNATGNVVQNNFIGIAGIGSAPLGNGRDGVQIDGARNNLIGGTTTIAGNNIANNTGAGVLVTDSNGAGTGNSILTNSIYDNQGLGIDLAPGVQTNTGVTANDSLDADSGPNNLQNLPVLTAVSTNNIQGTINSAGSVALTIQFFYSPVCDGSGHGEGKTFIGQASILTLGNGNGAFNYPSTPIPAGSFVTATATDGSGNTSEFSACQMACADITFTPLTLPNGFTGTAYNETITANPTDNYTYAVTGGALPTGLNFGSNGALTGTPTTPGSYTFTVTATTPEGCTGSQTYTIFINCPGATITVTTAADEDGTNPGGCSLREAIQAANNDSPVGGCPAGVTGLDTIYFYIGTGTPTINILGSQLPTILQPVIIDGSQCQSTRVELNGAGAGSNARGFLITAGNSTIRSMVINRFTESAISIATGGGNVVENCYLGTNSTGTAALGNGRDGVRIASSPNNRIGGFNSTVRNLISGNNEYGILISFAGATGNQVVGNYIGLHVNGTQAIGNGLGGVRISDAQNNLIGGTAGGSRNYISGNVLDGVFLLGPNATGNVVQNNAIGIAGIGSAPLGNGRDGVQIDGARDNLIGGTTSFTPNDIANNAGAGVLVTDSAGAGTGNSILTNSIYNNQGLGIDLAPGSDANTGVTANDSDDGDSGPNELQNFPIVTLATHALVTGTLNSKPNTTYRIQAFVHSGCDSSGHGEGSVYLGHADITTNASGAAGFSIVPITGAFTVGTAATATATEFVSGVLRSTSEFSACQTVTCPVVNIAPATLDEGTESLAYSQQLTQTGLPTTPAPMWSISAGGLPAGLGIDPATGLISGTTFVTGNHTFTVRVQDANGCFGERQYTLKIRPFCDLPVFNPDVLPNGRVGMIFSQLISVTGVPEPQTFSLSSGIFPPGINLSPAGLLSGTPTQDGIFNFAIKVMYETSCEAIKGYTLQVVFCQPITVNPSSIPNGFVGTAYNQTFTASGGSGPYSFTRVNGTLPPGLALATSGAITGTPTTAGTFTFEVRATDANGCFGERGYTVNIGGSGLQFYPLPSARRALETRPGFDGDVTPGAPILANTTLTLVMRTGCPACIPANATAVTGNITVVPGNTGGYLTLFPSNSAQPVVANSNFKPQEVTNNVFTVGLGPADAAFKIFASATTDVIVDVTGYFAPPSPEGLYFHPLNEPVRLVETRTLPGLTGCIKPGAPFPAGATLVQGRSPVAAPCNVIPDTAQVLVGNATTIFPSAGGFLTLYSSDAIRPLAANSNYAGGDVINGPFAVKLGADGKFNVFTPAATELVIDILGYYSADAVDANGAGLLFTILPKPIRELETRPDFPGFPLTGCFRTNAPIQGGTAGTRTQQIWGTCDGINIPNAARAVLGNVTVVNPAPNPVASGYLTHYPGNVVTPPTVATSNYPIPVIFGYNRFFVVGLSPTDGTFKIFTSTTTDVILDVSGYFAP